MEKSLFCESMKNEVKKNLPEELKTASVKIISQVNNNVKKMGIMIREEGSNVFPTFYLDSTYEKVNDGELTIEEAAQDVVASYVSHRRPAGIEDMLKVMSDYEQAKPNLTTRIIAKTENNAEYLKETLSEDFLDLTEFCIIEFPMEDGVMGSVKVNRNAPVRWGKTEEEVFRAAKENNAKKGYVFEDIAEVMEKLTGQIENIPDCMEDVFSIPSGQMYILSNRERSFGAVALTDEKELRKVYEKLQNRFYIIPSSVHELFIIPFSEYVDERYIQGMIRDVNENAVDPEDKLSDNLYFYDGERVSVKWGI